MGLFSRVGSIITKNSDKEIMKNTKIFPLLVLAILFVGGCAKSTNHLSNQINVWHWMSDREEAFQVLAARYEAATGIQVKFDLYAPSESYSQKVKAAAQTNTLPDVFGVLGETKDLASFIRSGYVANLEEDFGQGTNSWKNEFFEKAVLHNQFLENNEYQVEAGLYGVPLDVMTMQFLYNKKLLKKAGLNPESPPRTWVEFMNIARALKKAGISTLVGGFGEIWMLDAFSSNLAMNLMGEAKVFDTYRGKVAYTDSDWVEVLNVFKQMADEDVMVKGSVTMVNKAAEQTFANERAAFAFNGSWCVNVYKGMNPNLDYAAILPPRLSENYPMKVWGGAGSTLMVNAKSPKKDLAIGFLKWFTAAEQQAFLADTTQNLPSNRNSLLKISPVLSQFADDIEGTIHPSTYPVHESHMVSEAWAKGIQSILIGEKTPEQVAAEVQGVKEREIARKSK